MRDLKTLTLAICLGLFLLVNVSAQGLDCEEGGMCIQITGEYSNDTAECQAEGYAGAQFHACFYDTCSVPTPCVTIPPAPGESCCNTDPEIYHGCGWVCCYGTTTTTIPETTPTTTLSTSTTTKRKGGGGGGGGGGMTPTGGGTCFDGLKNCHHHQCEEDVDCGGPCQPCPTCSDGIQNQGETGVDCGGPCSPCPTTTTIKGLPNITTTTTTQVPMKNETTTTSTTLVASETSTTREEGGAVGRIVGIQLKEAALLGIALLLIFLTIFLITKSKKKKSSK